MNRKRKKTMNRKRKKTMNTRRKSASDTDTTMKLFPLRVDPPLVPYIVIDWHTLPADRTFLKNYRPVFYQYFALTKANIILLGAAQSGKSALINSILSMLKQQVYIDNPATSREGSVGGAVTRNYAVYDLSDWIGPQLGFSLWDSWGWTTDNYQGPELAMMLDGNIPLNFPIERGSTVTYNTPGINKNPQLSDRIHTIILVVPEDQANNGAYFNKFRNFLSQADARGLNTIVLLTKIDKIGSLGNNLRRVTTDDDVNNACNSIAKLTGLAIGQIFPVSNYTLRNQDATRDILLARILKVALQNADDYLTRQKQGLIFN